MNEGTRATVPPNRKSKLSRRTSTKDGSGRELEAVQARARCRAMIPPVSPAPAHRRQIRIRESGSSSETPLPGGFVWTLECCDARSNLRRLRTLSMWWFFRHVAEEKQVKCARSVRHR